MTALSPFEPLLLDERGAPVPLPPAIKRLVGPFRLPASRGRAHVIANFASTLDGVVSLGLPGRSGGGEITNSDPHDRMLMGLLRALADAVVVGAGTLRAVPHHRWTPKQVYPAFEEQYADLRRARRLPPVPLNVVVSAGGELDLDLPVFSSGEVPALIATTRRGERRIARRSVPESVTVRAVGEGARLTASAVLDEVARAVRCRTVLVEGGPHLLAEFVAERRLDELFLTLAPQIAGRGTGPERLPLVVGRLFAPTDAVWASLAAVRRAGEFLFLRYRFSVLR